MKQFNLILLLALFFVVLSCNKDKKDDQKGKDSKELTTDSLKTVQNDLSKNKTANSDSVQAPVTTTKEEKKEEKHKYFVIVGSFKEYKNAEKLLKNISTDEKESSILDPYKKFNRVSYKVYDTKDKALREVERFKKNNKQQDVWILTQ